MKKTTVFWDVDTQYDFMHPEVKPVASLRSARGAQMAGFTATSNVFAARELSFATSGTMAHSFVEAHGPEEQSFLNFAHTYGEKATLLVDTYDCIEGIKKAAKVAKQIYN